MAERIRLWQVVPDEHLVAVPQAPLNLEERLQKWLAKDIAVLDSRLLVIGYEVPTDFGGYIDLLCMDEVGNLVVVELKRDKTPRDVVGQTLDYASWVAGLSNERVTNIANGYLNDLGLEQSFANRFGVDLPETLNASHRMLIVCSQLDDSSERIVRYLSDQHGVNINVATFQYFHASSGPEFLGRVLLMAPTEVDRLSQSKGTSKSRPNLSYEELAQWTKDAGVGSLYERVLQAFEPPLHKYSTKSSLAFYGDVGGSRKVVFSVLPGESSDKEGLRYQLYANRFAKLAGLSGQEMAALVPKAHEAWIAWSTAGVDGEGFQGFIDSSIEIDRLASVLRREMPGA